jgi:predicted ATPase
MANAAYTEAAAALSRALEQLELLPPSSERDMLEINLRAGLGLALISIKGFSAREVERVFRRGLELAERQENVPLRILYGIWAFHMLRCDVAETARIVPLYERVAQQSSDDNEMLVSYTCLGARAFFRARYEEAMQALDRAVALCDTENPAKQNAALLEQHSFEALAQAPLFRAWGHLFAGRVAACEHDVNLGLDLAERSGHPYVLCSALGFAAPIAHDMSDLNRALLLGERMHALAEQKGFIYWLGSALIVKGWAIARRGAGAEGLAMLETGLGVFKAMGAYLTYAYYLSYRIETLLDAGRIGDALTTTDEALRAGEDGLNIVFVPELRRLKGEALVRTGDLDTAEHEFELAVAATRAQRAHLLRLRAACSLGQLLVQTGRRHEAMRVVGEALRALPDDCRLAEVERARELLASAGA